jgi:hypothetical protein
MVLALEENHTHCLGGDGPLLEMPLAYKERIFHQASTGRKSPHRLTRLVLARADMLVVKQLGSEYHCWGSTLQLGVF